jgi:hypothetical protein
MDPAATLWLSLIMATSNSPIRLFVPPPHRTAYFSSGRSPGVVFRVSSTWTPVPANARVQARGWVAIPESRQTRLSRDRSATNSARARPRSMANVSPGVTSAPSSTWRHRRSRQVQQFRGLDQDRRE